MVTFLTPLDLELTNVYKKGVEVLTSVRCTEFEYKVCRHLLRSKNKKKACTERVSEFATQTKVGDKTQDWELLVSPALVALVKPVLE